MVYSNSSAQRQDGLFNGFMVGGAIGAAGAGAYHYLDKASFNKEKANYELGTGYQKQLLEANPKLDDKTLDSLIKESYEKAGKGMSKEQAEQSFKRAQAFHDKGHHNGYKFGGGGKKAALLYGAAIAGAGVLGMAIDSEN